MATPANQTNPLIASLLPKRETNADRFLKENPEYDGRGVKVAIFDTGVDPGSAGLNKTSHGQPKIVDLLDCTGAGDVTLQPLAQDKVRLDATKGIYELTGLSGRTLILPSKLVTGPGAWQLGLKRIYELWPKDLVRRVSKQRKERFMQEHHTTVAAAQSAIDNLAKGTGQKPQDKKEGEDEDDALLRRKEAEAQIAALESLAKEYTELGPAVDCVVFRPEITTELDKASPEKQPWAIVDVSETGDLSKSQAMRAYHIAQEWACFCDESLMSYSFNFYDENILSIVTCSGTHGTHVAGIVAANFEENPVLNGVAPGAQIISMKIGDDRLDSLETSQSFMRAMTAAINLGVDCINISFGEDSDLANAGPVMDYMRDKVIRKHGITVVSSAGNNGPGYSTIGAPGGMTTDVVSVGAYVSKEMAEAMYALRSSAGDSPYTWSSRGPSIDGDIGVTIFAPGAAVTCVPPYALNHSQLMNGTSMSSPNACGNIALLISALKAEGKPYTPGSLRRALVRTGKDVGDEFGTRMLDVVAAHVDLVKGEPIDPEFYIDVKVDGQARGVLLRELEALVPTVFNVELKPFFRQEATRKKFDLDLHLNLHNTASHVSTASFITLNNTGRTIQVKVDPTSLTPGLYISSIEAKIDEQTLFSIPVTVIKPEAIEGKRKVELRDLTFTSGRIERRFFAIPKGVRGATLRVTSRDIATPVQLWGAVTQFLPLERRTRTSTAFATNLGDSLQAAAFTKTFKLVGGVTAEICFAQFWSSLADKAAVLDFELDLHGLSLLDGGSEVALEGGSGYKRLTLCSNIGVEEVKPSARLDMVRRHLRPTESTLTALGERDVLENKDRLYELVAQYTVKVDNPSAEISVVLPVSGTLYETPFMSSLYQIYDGRKNLVKVGSTYPEKIKLDRGTYTLRAELVHSDRALLDKLDKAGWIVAIDTKLDKAIDLDLYNTHLTVWTGPKHDFKNERLSRGGLRSFVVGTSCDTPKEAAVGDILLGSLQLGAQKELSTRLKLVVPPAKITGSSGKSSASKSDKKKESEADESAAKKKRLLDLQIDLSTRIVDAKDRVAYLEDLHRGSPEDLACLGALLEAVPDPTEKLLSSLTSSTAGKDEVITADDSKDLDTLDRLANSVKDLCKADELALYYGTRQDGKADLPEDDPLMDDAAREKRRLFSERKDWLIKALDKQVRVELVRKQQQQQQQQQQATGDSGVLGKGLDQGPAVLAYLRWSTGDGSGKDKARACVLRSRMYLAGGQNGRALNEILAASKALADNPTGGLYGDAALLDTVRSLRSLAIDRLGWSCWRAYEREVAIGRDPGSFIGF
ncbi:hypothetical protein PYCC9005_004634 [Savitreella phatthalungensis]